MPRHETTTQAKKSALESDYAPLYAVAGLTDVLTDTLRKRLSDLQRRGPALQRQALTNAEELRTFVVTLPEQVLQLPRATRSRVSELQAQAGDLLAQATATYAALAGRGKIAVDEAVGTARGLSGRAEKRVEDLRREAGDRVDPLLERVEEGVVQARRTVTGRTATETVVSRSDAEREAEAARKAAEQEAAYEVAEAQKAAEEEAAYEVAAAKKAAAKKVSAAKKEATAAELEASKKIAAAKKEANAAKRAAAARKTSPTKRTAAKKTQAAEDAEAPENTGSPEAGEAAAAEGR